MTTTEPKAERSGWASADHDFDVLLRSVRALGQDVEQIIGRRRSADPPSEAGADEPKRERHARCDTTIPEVREAIQAWIEHQFRLTKGGYTPEQVHMTSLFAAVDYGIDMATDVLTDMSEESATLRRDLAACQAERDAATKRAESSRRELVACQVDRDIERKARVMFGEQLTREHDQVVGVTAELNAALSERDSLAASLSASQGEVARLKTVVNATCADWERDAQRKEADLAEARTARDEAEREAARQKARADELSEVARMHQEARLAPMRRELIALGPRPAEPSGEALTRCERHGIAHTVDQTCPGCAGEVQSRDAEVRATHAALDALGVPAGGLEERVRAMATMRDVYRLERDGARLDIVGVERARDEALAALAREREEHAALNDAFASMQAERDGLRREVQRYREARDDAELLRPDEMAGLLAEIRVDRDAANARAEKAEAERDAAQQEAENGVWERVSKELDRLSLPSPQDGAVTRIEALVAECDRYHEERDDLADEMERCHKAIDEALKVKGREDSGSVDTLEDRVKWLLATYLQACRDRDQRVARLVHDAANARVAELEGRLAESEKGQRKGPDYNGEQIESLARFILTEIPGEPSRSEGAVDTAIRWMREARSQLDAARASLDDIPVEAIRTVLVSHGKLLRGFAGHLGVDGLRDAVNAVDAWLSGPSVEAPFVDGNPLAGIEMQTAELRPAPSPGSSTREAPPIPTTAEVVANDQYTKILAERDQFRAIVERLAEYYATCLRCEHTICTLVRDAKAALGVAS